MHILPSTRDLVLVGGGHAHALVLRAWAMHPLPGARLTLIDPAVAAPYTGMLPGLIAGHYPRAALEVDLVRLARHAGARLILNRAVDLDLESGTVRFPDRPPVAFDVLSLDIGITSELPELPGFAEHAVPAKPLRGYATRWERFLRELDAGRVDPRIVVIGGGIGGVELALAMAHRLRDWPSRRITIIESAARILPELPAQARDRLSTHLDRAGIECVTSASVARIAADRIELADGRALLAALCLGAAGSRPQQWLAGTGLQLTDGYISVGPTLTSLSHENVFAVGDCAHLSHAPRPKAGVFAVRAAPVLAYNLRAALTGAKLRSYRPQRDYLKLISLGARSALAEKWGRTIEGRWLWQLKNQIDRRFMKGLIELPSMPAPPRPRSAAKGVSEMLAEKPLCGGCGAKVGPGALRQALADLPEMGAGIALGVGDDAAVLVVGEARIAIATDHLRAVTEDPWLMARIAAVHALGDIWAMGAAPQAALASVILPQLSEPLQRRTLAEVMAGAAGVMREAGASIVGGHSTMGAELTIGFTVTGLVTNRFLTKAGARPGDALILTKPLGSGTLLAAEMQKRADGRHVAALWQMMTQPQGRAASILAPTARAMTDVTGFGLAGHLDEMLRASGVAADLELSALPLLAGAEALAAAGIASTIAPANRAALIGRIDAPRTARAALLYDPQTAGGLLAAVPEAEVERLLCSLRDEGYAAARIGAIRASDGAPPLRVR